MNKEYCCVEDEDIYQIKEPKPKFEDKIGNYIVTPLGNKIIRKKWERQWKFKKRAESEYRQQLKDLFRPDLKGKEYNGAIYKIPILDMNGINVLDYSIDMKRAKKEGIKWKYLKLKVKVVEDE